MSRYESFENMAAAIEQGIFHEADEVATPEDETRDELNAQVVLQVVTGEEFEEEVTQ